MASPTSECKAIILATVPSGSWSTKTDVEILADIKALPQVPNPVPQGTVLPQLSTSSVLGLLSTSSRASLATVATIPSVREDIINQVHDGVVQWAGLYAEAGLITPGEYANIVAFVTTEIPDLTWQSHIDWDVSVFGRSLDVEDITETRSIVQETP